MNFKILLFALIVAVLGSCTAYRTGQTPDDLYYSAPRHFVTASTDDRDEVIRRGNKYDYEEREIRMSINSPRWRNFDYDYYDYNYSPYYYGYNHDYYYNPYYCSYPVYNTVIFHPGPPLNSTPRTTNLSSYSNNNFNNTNYVKVLPGKPVRTYGRSSSSNRNSYSSDYNKNNSTSSDNYSGNSRDYTPSSGSNNNGSSSAGSSGSGTISRPQRNGN